MENEQTLIWVVAIVAIVGMAGMIIGASSGNANVAGSATAAAKCVWYPPAPPRDMDALYIWQQCTYGGGQVIQNGYCVKCAN